VVCRIDFRDLSLPISRSSRAAVTFTDLGADTEIDFGGGDKFTLLSAADPNDLVSDDFLFV